MAAGECRFPWRSERGVALLTVLLVTALMTVLVLAMTWQRQLELRRTANRIESDQTLLLTVGLEEWAGKILQRDRNSSDNLGETWAVGLPPTPVEQGMVSGNIQDLQGRFNINNLFYSDQAGQEEADKQLGRLLEMCGGDPLTAAAVADWLDNDSDIRTNGAEDREYLIRQPPYRTGNRPMASPTELLLVSGISGAIYDCLANSITTLPEATKLNVNTASPLAIAALSDDLTLEQAEEVVKARPADGYAKLDDFQAQLPAGTGFTNTAGLGLISDYFLVEARANFGHAEVVLYSVMHRTGTGMEVNSRSIGTY
jgi:general secretion pathway protein K